MDRRRTIARNSVHTALNVVGDRWSHLIVQATLDGPKRFEALRQETGAPRSTLSKRLKSLIAAGVVTRAGDTARSPYRLTPMGADLSSALALARAWGEPAGAGAKAVCAHCGGEIRLYGCSHQDGPGAGRVSAEFARRHLTRREAGDTPLEIADIAADRWSGMVISAQFFGLHRFDEIQASLDIATNILTDRLRGLEAAGVLERRLYASSPPRHEYRLTERGRALYPYALALMQWADRWMPAPDGSPVVVTHLPCGMPLDLKVLACTSSAPFGQGGEPI